MTISKADGYVVDKLLTYRIVRSNFLYAIGIPDRIAKESELRSSKLFGAYGNVINIKINPAPKGYYNGQLACYV